MIRSRQSLETVVNTPAAATSAASLASWGDRRYALPKPLAPCSSAAAMDCLTFFFTLLLALPAPLPALALPTSPFAEAAVGLPSALAFALVSVVQCCRPHSV